MVLNQMGELDISRSIEQRYSALTPKLRKAARYIQRNLSTVAFQSLRECAVAADVSPTTLNRLAGEFGFESYARFREALREPMRRPVGLYAELAANIVEDSEARESSKSSEESFTLLANTIHELREGVPNEVIENAAQLIAKADRVHIAGFRALYAPAFYLCYLLRTFREGVALVEGRAGLLLDELGLLARDDVLLLMSYEPYAIEAVKVSEAARQAGVRTVAITDTVLSPVSQAAEITLVVPTVGVSFYQSMVPTTALLETLAMRILRNSGSGVLKHIKDEFDRRERMGAYWNDKKG